MENYQQMREPDKIIKKYFDRYFDYFLIFCGFSLGIYLDWKAEDVIFLGLATYTIIKPVSGRQLINFSVLSLFLMAVSAIGKRDDLTELLAKIVFYLLILLLITLIKNVNEETAK
jgi:hypothetical protein